MEPWEEHFISTYIIGNDGKIQRYDEDTKEFKPGKILLDLFYMTLNPLPEYKWWILTRDKSIPVPKEFRDTGSSSDTLAIHPYFIRLLDEAYRVYVKNER